MFKIEMPSRDIPSDPSNLSPALASMVAQILMPQQYGRIMGDTVLNINEQCPRAVSRIEK